MNGIIGDYHRVYLELPPYFFQRFKVNVNIIFRE